MKREYKKVEVRDQSEGYTGEQPKRGLYDGRLFSAEEHDNTEATPGTIHWTFEITQEPYAGWRGHMYTNDTTTAWKEVQTLLAMGIIDQKDVKNDKITKDLDLNLAKLPEQAGPVRMRLVNQKYDDETVPTLRSVLPPREGQEALNGTGKKGKKGKSGKKAEEPF